MSFRTASGEIPLETITAEVSNGGAEDPGSCSKDSVDSALSELPIAAVPRKGRSRRSGQTRFCAPNACCKDEKCEKLNTLTAVPLTGSVCSISEEEFVQINMMVDSGATETVMTETDLDGVIDITEGVQCKRGQHYQCANGSNNPNLGERKFLGWTEEDGQKGHHGTGMQCDSEPVERQWHDEEGP